MTETFDPQESFGFMVNYLARLYARALYAEIEPLGVAPGQFPVLLMLYQGEGRTVTELSQKLKIEQPTLTNTLKRMERDGLIERRPHPSDRRALSIYLTEKAQVLREPLFAKARAINAKSVAGLSEAERRGLKETLRTMAQALET